MNSCQRRLAWAPNLHNGGRGMCTAANFASETLDLAWLRDASDARGLHRPRRFQAMAILRPSYALERV
jgi:hypothetical protein